MNNNTQKERHLQVYYQNRFEKNNPGYNNIQLPLIKFSGYWLQKAGFNYQDNLEIIVNDGQIVINNMGV